MFWEKIIFLCEQRGESPNLVCKNLGLSSAIATKWKNGSVPRDTTLLKIADYFGVSVAYLKGEEEATVPTRDEVEFIEQDNIYRIPVFDSASAGFGAYASNDVVEYIMMYFSSAAEAEQTICVRVRGDSMYPKIEDGDIIQVHKQEAVDNGSIAVVLIDGDEGLVKKVFINREGIELVSINPMYPPMEFLGKDAERIRVVGLVTKITKAVNGRGHDIIVVPSGNDKKDLLDLIDDADITEDQAKEIREFVLSLRKKK